MAETQDIAIVNARLVDPATGREGAGSVLLRNGTIADVEWGAAPATGEGVHRIDAKGLVLAPGLIDLRAFLGEPGAEFRETLGTGSHAAAAGGVTTRRSTIPRSSISSSVVRATRRSSTSCRPRL